MKIDYKITTIILAGLLLVTYAWNWQGIFDYDNNMQCNMGKMNMSDMHMMPDGSMMNNDGSGMDMDMDMGDMTMNDMVGMMEGKTGKALEKEFLVGMVPHHQGAVDMANLLLKDKTVSPQVANFAREIIKAQESEIKMMNEWLKNY